MEKKEREKGKKIKTTFLFKKRLSPGGREKKRK